MLNKRQYAAIALKARGNYAYAKAKHVYKKPMSGAYARKLARKEKEIFGTAPLEERMLAFVNREEDLPILDRLPEGSKKARDYRRLLDEASTRSDSLDVAMAIAVESGKSPSWATDFLRTHWTPEKRRIGKEIPSKTRTITPKLLKERIHKDIVVQRSERCPNCRGVVVDGECKKCGLVIGDMNPVAEGLVGSGRMYTEK